MMTNSPVIEGSWDEWEKANFSPEEIAESDLRVESISELTKTRQERPAHSNHAPEN